MLKHRFNKSTSAVKGIHTESRKKRNLNKFLTADSSCTKKNIFEKTDMEFGRSHLYASFDTFSATNLLIIRITVIFQIAILKKIHFLVDPLQTQGVAEIVLKLVKTLGNTRV